MPKNKKEDSDEEDEYEKEELSSLEKRRLRVIKREENIKKRKLNNDQKNVKSKKLKFVNTSSEEEFDFSQETDSDSECSTLPSEEESDEDVKEMVFYLPPGDFNLEEFEKDSYDTMLENLKKTDKDAYENFLKVKKNMMFM